MKPKDNGLANLHRTIYNANISDLFVISSLFLMNKNYRFIDKTYQQSNSMLLNILISIILRNFATSTLQKSKLYIIIHRNEVI